MFWCVCLVALVVAAPSHSLGERHKVVVVGAGVAGFAATAWLLEHNVTSVLVLEASDRIGGRIHTVEFEGITIDKGAEFVHGEVDNIVYELVPHELLTSYSQFNKDGSKSYVGLSGKMYNESYIDHLIYQGIDVFEEHGLVDTKSGRVSDYFTPRYESILRANNVSQDVREALEHFVPLKQLLEEGADDLSVLGAWTYNQQEITPGDQSLKWKCLGYKTIFSILSKGFYNSAEELPVVNQTLFNKEVTLVERRDGEVEVQCADGSSYLADHVIVTVSLGVLKKNAARMFSPPLPDKKSTAIQTLGFGCVAKVFLLFPSRWWPSTKASIIPLFSKEDRNRFKENSLHGSWTTNTAGIYETIQNDRLLCAWYVGESCRTMESLTEEEVIDGLMELLNSTIGHSYPDIPRPQVLRTTWATNPLTLGSYSFHSVESDQHNTSNDDLAKPILYGEKPVILFAGEATHPHRSSCVHGAIETGRREAQRIVDYLSQTVKTSI